MPGSVRPPPEEVQPTLGWWGHTWRLLAMLVISGLGLTGYRRGISGPELALDLALGTVSYVLVRWRRRWPVPVALVLCALTALSGTAAGPATLAQVSVATRRRAGEIAAVTAATFVGAEVFLLQHRGDHTQLWVDTLLNVVVTSATIGWGLYLGSRRELLWTLRDRAARAEAEQEVRVAQAQLAERGRIAREMHDVLAHRISQISLHAGALSYRTGLDDAEVQASAAVIRDSAHQALIDLRAVLGVLRDATGEVQHAPQPTYGDVGALVADARAGGQRIELRDDVERPEEVPAAVGRTVFRIVQEGITNARKHAPDAVLTISLRGSAVDGIDVELRNPLGFGPSVTPGAGLGLVGLTERAQLGGGRLVHRREGGDFVLKGWVPWTAQA